ncbi:MAG: HAMP domain-containing sensor histidine kinase [Fibrobacterota bacterium]
MRLSLILVLAILLPSALLVLFGLRAVRNERFVLEHRLASEYRDNARSLLERADRELSRLDSLVRRSPDPRALSRADHPWIGRIFILGMNGRVVWPTRMMSRRAMPAAFYGEFPEAAARWLAGASVCGAALQQAPSAEGEERLWMMSAFVRCGVRSGNFAGARRMADRILQAPAPVISPVSVSRDLLGLYHQALVARASGAPDRGRAAFERCYRYLVSDTASVYLEEFHHYTARLERELANTGARPAGLDALRSAACERLRSQRVIARLENYAERGFLPDTGFIYRDSSVVGFLRLADGRRACVLLENRALSATAADWARGEEGIGLSVSFIDGFPLYQTHPDAVADENAFVFTEEIHRRLPFITLTLTERNPGELSRMLTAHRTTYLLFLTLLLVTIAAGAALTYRAVRRELFLSRLRSNFISGVSHELKTPLTSIHMLSEMLQSGRVTDEKKRAEYYALITRESERLTHLINNMLDFSRVDDGRIRYDLAPNDAEAVLDEALFSMAALLDERDAAINRTRSRTPLLMRCDRKMMVQVFINLLDNAAKYSPERPVIDLFVTRDNGCVAVSVRDHGIGILETDREKIFEAFYRADNERVKEVKGTGLGLALVRRVVSDHGGTVTAEPAEGGGLRITVAIPEGAADGPARQKEKPA